MNCLRRSHSIPLVLRDTRDHFSSIPRGHFQQQNFQGKGQKCGQCPQLCLLCQLLRDNKCPSGGLFHAPLSTFLSFFLVREPVSMKLEMLRMLVFPFQGPLRSFPVLVSEICESPETWFVLITQYVRQMPSEYHPVR